VTLCLLIRHAALDPLDRILVGRNDDDSLNTVGRVQMRGLANRLQPLRVSRIQSSPRRRALESAAPIAERFGVRVEVCDALDEVDFGDWTGRTFEELAHDAEWQRWNRERSRGRAPGGESTADVQARIVRHLERMHAEHPVGRIIMVSHAEVIRTAVLYYRGLPLDAWSAVEVPPASITRIPFMPPGYAHPA
jgi:probable phosphoglycerate mutase